jgi:hypothetical protein
MALALSRVSSQPSHAHVCIGSGLVKCSGSTLTESAQLISVGAQPGLSLCKTSLIPKALPLAVPFLLPLRGFRGSHCFRFPLV